MGFHIDDVKSLNQVKTKSLHEPGKERYKRIQYKQQSINHLLSWIGVTVSESDLAPSSGDNDQTIRFQNFKCVFLTVR